MRCYIYLAIDKKSVYSRMAFSGEHDRPDFKKKAQIGQQYYSLSEIPLKSTSTHVALPSKQSGWSN